METQTGSFERRASKRVRMVAEVGLESPSFVYTGLSSDISRGGIFVATHHRVPIGTPVRLQIVLRDARLEVQGVVRWQRAQSDDTPGGIGIAFSALGQRERALLDAICQDREPYFYDFEDA